MSFPVFAFSPLVGKLFVKEISGFHYRVSYNQGKGLQCLIALLHFIFIHAKQDCLVNNACLMTRCDIFKAIHISRLFQQVYSYFFTIITHNYHHNHIMCTFTKNNSRCRTKFISSATKARFFPAKKQNTLKNSDKNSILNEHHKPPWSVTISACLFCNFSHFFALLNIFCFMGSVTIGHKS